MPKLEFIETRQGWTVYEEDEEILKISHEDYIKFNLYEKESFTQKDVEELKNYIAYKNARRLAIKNNIFKNKSGMQIFSKLIDNNFPEDIAKRVIEEMKESGQIDELAIIKRFIKDRLKINPKSKKYLKFELLKKGFEGDAVEIIIREMRLSDETLAEELAEKKIIKGKDIEYIKKFLKNKGFDIYTIKRVINSKFYNNP